MKHEIKMPTPHSAPSENPLSVQKHTPVATPHDDLPSPEDDPPEFEHETQPVSPMPINVPPRPASPPATASGKTPTTGTKQCSYAHHTIQFTGNTKI